MDKILSIRNPFQVVSWGISINWIYDTCVVNLFHVSTYAESFSAAAIAHEAMKVFLECFTREQMYRGGIIGIGNGRNFLVTVGWRTTIPVDSLEGSLANNSSSI